MAGGRDRERGAGKVVHSMRMIEFAEKYQIPYHMVYQAMAEAGLLRKWRKDAPYDEQEMLDAVSLMIANRIARREREIFQMKRQMGKLRKAEAKA